MEYHRQRVFLFDKKPECEIGPWRCCIFFYIFEFKLDGSVEEALQQIESQGYARPFEMDRRKLVKIGVNFDSRTRSMDKWKIS